MAAPTHAALLQEVTRLRLLADPSLYSRWQASERSLREVTASLHEARAAGEVAVARASLLDARMAASAEAKDYVHLVTQGLTAKGGVAPQTMVKNIADFERAHAGYDIAGKLREAIDFQADLIILAISENVPALKTPEEQSAFQESVTKLLTALKAGRQPVVLVRSCFWKNSAKDQALQKASLTAAGKFVDISALSDGESNFARSERSFKNAGVANHPGDKGMSAIAAALLEALGTKK
jgi:alpha-galactosidase